MIVTGRVLSASMDNDVIPQMIVFPVDNSNCKPPGGKWSVSGAAVKAMIPVCALPFYFRV